MKTLKNKPKSPKKKAKSAKKAPKRKRKIPYVYTGDYHLEEELTAILYKGDQRLTVYVYRAKDGRLIKPFIRKCCPYEGLVGDIRDEFGSGQYAIFIRGKAIIFTGIIGVETPIGWVPPR
ncbi:MAG: hypothetical protein IID51_09105 [Proteobacteria bacterium]|nr:hypothetical protein [Pseudomonadota bacterium]